MNFCEYLQGIGEGSEGNRQGLKSGPQSSSTQGVEQLLQKEELLARIQIHKAAPDPDWFLHCQKVHSVDASIYVLISPRCQDPVAEAYNLDGLFDQGIILPDGIRDHIQKKGNLPGRGRGKDISLNELLFLDSKNSNITDQNYRSDLFSCMPWQEIRRTLRFTCKKRGYYSIRQADLVSYDLFL